MKKRILTGLQVTSDQFHLGNYFGAVKPFMDLCEDSPDADMFLFVAIMHSLNSVQDWWLSQNAYNTVKLYMACWIDLDKVFIYNQADVPAHAQLHRVLSAITNMWFMERMHVYKDAVAKGKLWTFGIGTFTYPILMAADIILYDATHVPVGKDQKQHVEFARDIAQKFNKMYGETFVLPAPMVKWSVATVPWIDGRKMSKSYNNYIWLLDDEKTLIKKIKKIPTSLLWIDDPKDPDECNVYKITKLLITEAEDVVLRKKYTDGWLSFKRAKDYLTEKVLAFVGPIQEKFATISDDEVSALLAKNAVIANELAHKKIKEVYQKVWFVL